MSQNFKALVIREINDRVAYKVEDNFTKKLLSTGDVLVKVCYSSVNYKDMLAFQKNGGIINTYPMIPGIDLSGYIEESYTSEYKKGQPVLVTGYSLGMNHTGGFSEYARVPASWIVPLPKGLNLKKAMVYGTAGLTAALSIACLEKNGMKASLDQNILVTGATGGVGSLIIKILSKIGYKHITALVRKEKQVNIAKRIGASKVILAQDFDFSDKPLANQKFHYILDTVGGDVLAHLIPYVYYNGSITLCGNAGGIKLNTTVLPFILRGINLLGIDSVNISQNERILMWERLSNEWDISVDYSVINEVTLETIPETIKLLKEGRHIGRTIVKIN